MLPTPRAKSQSVVFKLSEAQKATLRKFWEEWSRSSPKAMHAGVSTPGPGAAARSSGGAGPGPSGGPPRSV